ncbi:MAG TPA: carboxylating nicotinate-nucleotide diphosphorylase [Blastocatellia bacterium]|nr:carboxylating nicotinate-nucleotide diphosphorylase [Blastocatellia bacterium]
MDLDPNVLFNMASAFLGEDIGRGDVTTQATVRPSVRGRGRFLAKQPLVVAGLEVAEAIFSNLEPGMELEAFVYDGERAAEGQEFARIEGLAQVLLMGERTALNLIQRMSGIATVTRRYVDAIDGTRAQVVDTRKTAPGLRMLDKYAVLIGGGRNHRFGLDDGCLIKDNHIALAGGIREAMTRAQQSMSHLLRIEIEVGSIDDLREALQCGADAILLDNMSPERLREAVELVRSEPGGDDILLEASGRITLDNIRSYAETGVDLVSVGALTHSAPAADISFKIVPM